MGLAAEDRVLYSRQILLPEIGVRGQERLCEATFAFESGLDPEAAETAREYLQRAGLGLDPGSPRTVALAACDATNEIAQEPVLHHAAAALTGALTAVETIKAVLGLD